jgi:hypothetical protein
MIIAKDIQEYKIVLSYDEAKRMIHELIDATLIVKESNMNSWITINTEVVNYECKSRTICIEKEPAGEN